MTVNPHTTGEHSPRSQPLLATTPGLFGACIVCCLLWGSAIPCIKMGYDLFNVAVTDPASQMLFAGLRFSIAGTMVIIGMSAARRRFLQPAARDIRPIIVLALFQTIGQYVFYYLGLSRASGVTTSIVGASSSFIAILLAALAFRTERLSARKVLGCVAGFAGVAAIELGGMAPDSKLAFSLGGEGLILLSAVSNAMSTCLIGIFSKKHNPVLLSGWQFLTGGLILTVCALAADGHLDPTALAPGVPLLAYMGFISAMAYSLWSRLLAVNPVSRVTVFGFMTPIFGFLLSVALLGEGSLVSPVLAVAALGLVSAGIVIVNRPEHTARRSDADRLPRDGIVTIEVSDKSV